MVTLPTAELPAKCPLRSIDRTKPIPRQEPKPIVAQPRSEWPMFIRVVARWAKPEDIGVGDTLDRAATAMGHDVIVAGLRAVGIKCSCDERLGSAVQYCNARFPYQ